MKKSAKNTFPEIIHVVREFDRNDSYLVAHQDGVQSIEENGTPIAIYKLVSLGTVGIQRRFIPAGKESK